MGYTDRSKSIASGVCRCVQVYIYIYIYIYIYTDVHIKEVHWLRHLKHIHIPQSREVCTLSS